MNKYSKFLIYLDPGHGGTSPGATVPKMMEKDLNFAVALALGPLLLQTGFRVAYSRKEDKTMTLEQRVTQANNQNASIYLDIHHNAFTNIHASGMEVFYKKGDDLGKKLAETVLRQLIITLPMVGRGVKTREKSDGTPYYYTIRNSEAITILLESGFLTSPFDFHEMAKPEFPAREAIAIKKGLVEFIDKFVQPEPVDPQPAPTPDLVTPDSKIQSLLIANRDLKNELHRIISIAQAALRE